MEVFAIRHIPTQAFMPQRKQQKGSSHWTPGMVDSDYETGQPKLFHNKHAAVCAMASWLRGRVELVVQQGPEDPYPEHVAKVRKDPTRRKQDVEVVTFILIEQKIVTATMGKPRFHGALAHLNK